MELTEEQQKVRNEIIQASLNGRVDFEYPLTTRIVRIFTSSTFTGTFISRSVLSFKRE